MKRGNRVPPGYYDYNNTFYLKYFIYLREVVNYTLYYYLII